MVSGLVLLFTSWQLASTGAAQPATNTNGTVDYSVTMAARYCPTYSDVFANRARNNIMESLQDLGPDSPYTNFVAVDPSVEDGMAPQTSCKPLPNWTFAFGNGIASNANGTNLSYVTGTSSVNNRQVTTQASTPLLDTNGNPTGQQIAGATTFTLTSAELTLASQGNLWVMGGTPSQPLNGLGDQYGFAALRCAMDNLNGDNVEWIGFPSGMSHVFCYAFYVQPPPTAGTIVIKKSLTEALPAAQTFDFAGSLSYNPGGAFSVTVPANTTSAEETFIRGETGSNAPWTAAETIPDGFQLVGLTCVSQSGGSTITYSGNDPNSTVPGGNDQVNISLAAGDTVTCTFTNGLAPPPTGTGEINKEISTADGRPIPDGVLPQAFNYTVTSPTDTVSTVAVTVQPGEQNAGTGTIPGLTAGQWTITENLPAPAPGWQWAWVGTICITTGGVPQDATGPTVTVTVPSGGGASCTFTNQLQATGGLVVRFTTLGGTGTFGARLDSQYGEELNQSVTTTTAGAPAVATGESSNPLLGTWLVQPLAPDPTTGGHWVLASAPTCNASSPVTPVGPDQLQVELGTAAAPVLTCDFVYQLVAPSTLDLVKVIQGDAAAQQGNATISASCDDGATATLTVTPGQATPAGLATALAIPFPALCQISETATGAAPGASVTTTSAITTNGAAVPGNPAALTVGSDTSSAATVVTFTNTYAAAKSNGGGSGTTGGTGGAQLAASGFTGSDQDLAAAGALFVLIGTILVLTSRPRGRHARR
jgi:hypothetical protein